MTRRPASEALGLSLDRTSPAARAALVFVVAALWLLGRRYDGLVHDAVLYTGIGLRRLDGAALSGDRFFSGGAQDAYTLFPVLYAGLIDALGIGGAALAVTVSGQCAFVGAAAWLVWRIAPGPARWWSLAMLAIASGYYGGGGVFRFAETFATARSWAEPLVVAGLASIIGGRRAVAWSALAGAAVLHPLVAASGVAVVLAWQMLGTAQTRRLVLPAILVGAGTLVATAALPESRLDPTWLEPVGRRSPHLFLAQWLVPDWARLAWGFCVLAIALRFLAEAVRRLVLACAMIVLGGIIVTGIGVDLFDSATVAALQPWRAHWLLHLLALVLVPVGVIGLWPLSAAARAAAIGLAASVCFGRFGQPVALLLALTALAFVDLDRKGGAIGNRALRAVALVACCAAATGMLFDLQGRLPLQYDAGATSALGEYLPVLGSPAVLVPCGAMLFLLAHSPRPVIALGAAAALFVASLSVWDARTPWRRFLEDGRRFAAPFLAWIPPGAHVLWPAPGVPAWMLLGRASWFSVDQGAGIIFSRSTALTYAAREEASRALRSAIENCAASAGRPCAIGPDAAHEACAAPGGPDFLVVNAPIASAGVRAFDVAWRVPQERGADSQLLWFYRCAELGSAGPPPK
ncbi:MAG: hypothetical protein IT514_00505 [Burkholderiales bacterium]|nr:hypothetical protein [Burkholderiales bacterium]